MTGSMLLLGLTVNWLTALLSLAGFVWYVFIYTVWLKRPYAAEHRDRWRGRGVPRDAGMGRGPGTTSPRPQWACSASSSSGLLPTFWRSQLLMKEEYAKVGFR